MFKKLLGVLAVALGAVAGVASAAIDVTATTTFISGDLTTAFITVAAAILAFYGTVLAYKVIKRWLR